MRTLRAEMPSNHGKVSLQIALSGALFRVRATVGGRSVEPEDVLNFIGGCSRHDRFVATHLVALDGCSQEGVPLVEGAGCARLNGEALRKLVAEAVTNASKGTAIDGDLRYAVSAASWARHRGDLARTTGRIMDRLRGNANLKEVLVELTDRARRTSEALGTSFNLMTGTYLRHLKAQIALVAREFGADFEHLGFPQLDVTLDGNKAGLARKCEAIGRHASIVAAAIRLGEGSLPHNNAQTVVRRSVALKITDSEILPRAATVWSRRAAFVVQLMERHAGEGTEAGARPAPAMELGLHLPAAAAPAPVTEAERVAPPPGPRLVEPGEAEVLRLVERRLGGNIAALLRNALDGHYLTGEEQEDVDAALGFLAERHAEMRAALRTVAARAVAGHAPRELSAAR